MCWWPLDIQVSVVFFKEYVSLLSPWHVGRILFEKTFFERPNFGTIKVKYFPTFY